MVHGLDYHPKVSKARNGNFKINHSLNLEPVSPTNVEEIQRIEKHRSKELVKNVLHVNKLKEMQLFYHVNIILIVINVLIN
jgi:hypothetical protein